MVVEAIANVVAAISRVLWALMKGKKIGRSLATFSDLRRPPKWRIFIARGGGQARRGVVGEWFGGYLTAYDVEVPRFHTFLGSKAIGKIFF